MAFQSKNMNYIYHVSYFEGIQWDNMEEKETKKANERLMEGYNREIEGFNFKAASPSKEWKNLKGYRSFELYTMYPGLLIGTGNEHSVKIDGASKCGFTFDYTTGLPYIPGSSLKGALRACFPGDKKSPEMSSEYENYIKGILNREDLDVNGLKEQIFENRDVFLGVFPIIGGNGSQLMQMEFVTPHTKGRFKNPQPISQIKVKPNVQFEFCFMLTDYEPEDGSQPVTAEEKLALFKTLILDMGMGAKTHVGFGRFSEKKTRMAKGYTDGNAPVNGRNSGGQNRNSHTDDRRNNGSQNNIRQSGSSQSSGGRQEDGEAPLCAAPGCRRHVGQNRNTGQWYKYCSICGSRRR